MTNPQRKSPQRETRTYTIRLEHRGASSGAAPRMKGHAAVFGEEADIGGMFREVVAPGAFADTIAQDDIRALFNHNADFVLGRNVAGTLTLREDANGLAVEILPPDTQAARDLITSMERGDITQMSFGFQVTGEEWKEEDGQLDLRTLTSVRLFDVSPVTFPAYEGTDIALRSRDAWHNHNRPRLDRARQAFRLLKHGPRRFRW